MHIKPEEFILLLTVYRFLTPFQLERRPTVVRTQNMISPLCYYPTCGMLLTHEAGVSKAPRGSLRRLEMDSTINSDLIKT
jgi:hypothetical protein